MRSSPAAASFSDVSFVLLSIPLLFERRIHVKTLRSYFCWLFGHSFICLFRYHWGLDRGKQGSESSHWMCQHCNAQKFEQSDT